MVILFFTLEFAGADAHKGQPVPVGLVHVGLDLEHEGGEIRAEHVDHPGIRGAGQGGGGHAQEFLQKRLHAEVGQGAAEEHGRQGARPDLVHVEVPSRAQQLHVVDEGLRAGFAQIFRHGGVVEIDLHAVGAVPARGAGEEQQPVLLPVVYAPEFLAGADGPVHGVGLDAQLLLQLVQQVEGVLGLPVHLVDEGEDGDVPHGADLEELPRLGLHALAAVDDHDRRVRGHEGAVGVLGEVLVAGGIEDVDAAAAVLELHDRGGDGDAALLLDLHPVGHGGAAVLFALDGARLGDGPAVEQEFFSQSGLAGVRMRDDRKRPPPADFFTQAHTAALH